MKRKLLLAAIGIVGLSLASCDPVSTTSNTTATETITTNPNGETTTTDPVEEESESYRDLDFELSIPSRDSALTVEYKTDKEINALIDQDFEYNENSTLFTTREALFDNYKSVMISASYSSKDASAEVEANARIIFDFETQSIYFHQYQNKIKDNKKESYEIETFGTLDENDGNGYTVASIITLDGCLVEGNYYSGVAKIVTSSSLALGDFKDNVKRTSGKSSLGHTTYSAVYSNKTKDYTYFAASSNRSGLEENRTVVNKNNLIYMGLMEMKSAASEMSYISMNEYFDKAVIEDVIDTKDYVLVPAKVDGDLRDTLPLVAKINNLSSWISYGIDQFLSELSVDLGKFMDHTFEKETA